MLRYPDTDRRLALAEGCERCPDLVACRNREPTATERENCRPYLRGELDRIGPEVVVPTGKHATRSVLALDDESIRGTGHDGFLDAVLDPIECRGLAATVVPLLHPSYRDVWASRLGHTNASYEQRVADVLREVVSV